MQEHKVGRIPLAAVAGLSVVEVAGVVGDWAEFQAHQAAPPPAANTTTDKPATTARGIRPTLCSCISRIFPTNV